MDCNIWMQGAGNGLEDVTFIMNLTADLGRVVFYHSSWQVNMLDIISDYGFGEMSIIHCNYLLFRSCGKEDDAMQMDSDKGESASPLTCPLPCTTFSNPTGASRRRRLTLHLESHLPQIMTRGKYVLGHGFY